MEYRTKTITGYSGRVKKSCMGVLVGLGLFVGGTILLWWNEGNYVHTRDSLNEAQSVTIELGDIDQKDPAKEGHLVHATGKAINKVSVQDPYFDLSADAIRLTRSVEYYQWIEDVSTETRTTSGGEEETITTYSYREGWADDPIDSSNFGYPSARTEHKNTVLFTLDDHQDQADRVGFGAYRLPKFLVDLISDPEPFAMELSDQVRTKLNHELGIAGAAPGPAPESDSASGQPPRPSLLHHSGNRIHLGKSPGNPAIGDMRITFTVTRPAVVSIIAKITGDSFEAFRASNGYTVAKLAMGEHSQESMYEAAHSENNSMTWILRGVGALLVCFGITALTAPLAVLASIIPFLGSLIDTGTKFVGMSLGIAWSLLIIAMAWLRFRPLIGIALLGLAVAFIVLFVRKNRKVAATEPPTEIS